MANFIIDSNVLLYLGANVINKQSEDASVRDIATWSDKEDKFILKPEPGKQFNDFFLSYFNSVLYPIRKSVDNLIFVFDKRSSWRKAYLKEYFKDNQEAKFEYKAGRKTDHNDKMFLYFEHFTNTIKYRLADIPGVTILEGTNVEADDFFKYIVDQHKDQKNIIWTTDSDLRQLLRYDNEESWNVILTPKGQTKTKKIYAMESFIKEIIEYKPSIFNFNVDPENSIKGIFKNLITNKDYKYHDVDPYKMIVTKIIEGDESDSIPNVFNGILSLEDTSKFTKLATKIIKKYPDFFSDLDNNIDQVCEDIIIFVEELYNVDLDKQSSTIKTNLKLNEKLIRLHLDNMPEHISDKIIDKYSQYFNTSKFDYNKFSDFIKSVK